MAGRLEESKRDIGHYDLIAFVHRNEIEFRFRLRAEIDLRAGMCRQFMMSGNKVGMAVSLDDVFDHKPVRLRIFEIDINVALRIDNGRFSTRSN